MKDKPRKLTRKQKAFADTLIANPKLSGTEAALRTYDTESRGMAALIAHNELKKPHVQAYMQKHSELATEAMLEMLDNSRKLAKTGGKDGAAYAGVAVTVAKDILDRVHGKAVQKTEVTSQTVTVNIDLSNDEVVDQTV